MEIIPSILSHDPDEAHALLTLCEGVTKRAHIDIIDGAFSANKTIYPEAYSDEIYKLDLDFHLMVKEPINWVKSCVNANATRIIGQIELMESQKEFCEAVLAENILCGLAIDLQTGFEAIDESVSPLLNVIVVMSVKAGFGGQEFDKSALDKLKKLAWLREEKGYTYRICDDGGVTFENLKELQKTGIDEISVGRRIFQGNLSDNIETWKKLISRYNE